MCYEIVISNRYDTVLNKMVTVTKKHQTFLALFAVAFATLLIAGALLHN